MGDGLLKLGIIGYGSVASLALTAIAQSPERPLELACILAKPDGAHRAEALLESLGAGLAIRRIVVTDIQELLALGPDLVAEAAGHESIAAHGAKVLFAGCDLIVTSAGSLAVEQLRDAMDRAAHSGGARYLICPGAIGGLDIISAAKLSGLTKLVYSSRKPAQAWRGTAAEKLVDLSALQEPCCFFEGNAREAARSYPQNANVAATLALLGPGFDKTIVQLIADPGVTRNTHTIILTSACVDVEMTIAGLPSPDNPKTSMTTGFALAAQIIEIMHRNDGRN